MCLYCCTVNMNLHFVVKWWYIQCSLTNLGKPFTISGFRKCHPANFKLLTEIIDLIMQLWVFPSLQVFMLNTGVHWYVNFWECVSVFLQLFCMHLHLPTALNVLKFLCTWGLQCVWCVPLICPSGKGSL